MSPRFSVVVPTRQRHQTLRHCLRTCLNQSFDDYEIIVCDNCSSAETRQVVDALAAPRLRYVRAAEPLAMSANWELALTHARGEFVTVLGDDDGLMPYALAEADQLVRQTSARALRWDSVVYTWPDHFRPEEANFLYVPLSRHVRQIDGRAQIAKMLAGNAGYWTLPMIYNSFIRRDLIETARLRAGRVIASVCPDIYSGIAFAYLAGLYHSVTVPLGISGLSGKSTGTALLRHEGGNPTASEFHALNARFGLSTHRTVPDLNLAAALEADSFQWAKQHLFPSDRLSLDRRRLTERCLRSLWTTEPGQRQQAIQRIRQSLEDQPDLLAWFETLRPDQLAPAARPPAHTLALGHDGQGLGLRADRFNVMDIEGAADLALRLVSYQPGQIRYDLEPRYEVEHRLVTGRWFHIPLQAAKRLGRFITRRRAG